MRSRYAVFFDLDSTLLDNSTGREAVLHVCRQVSAMQQGLDPDRLRKTSGEVWSSYRAEMQESWVLGKTDSLAVSREAWRRSLELCGCSSRAVVEAAVQIHAQVTRENFRLYEDVAETLAALKKANVRMALITNGPSDLQRSKLQILDIEHWFDAVVISGEIGRAKPAAAVFDRAVRQTGIRPADVWHVGDSLEADVAGARAAGLTAVWLNRTGKTRNAEDPEPHFEIETLAGLTNILQLA